MSKTLMAFYKIIWHEQVFSKYLLGGKIAA